MHKIQMEGIKKYYSEYFPDVYPRRIGGFIKPVIDYLNMDYESFKHDIYTMTNADILTKFDQMKDTDILNPYAIITMNALKRGYVDGKFLNEEVFKKIKRVMNNLGMINLILEFEYENEKIELNYENFIKFMKSTYGKSMDQNMFMELCKIKNTVNIQCI